MIAYLSGTVISKQDRTIILNVSGTGYLIYVPRSLLEKKIGRRKTGTVYPYKRARRRYFPLRFQLKRRMAIFQIAFDGFRRGSEISP